MSPMVESVVLPLIEASVCRRVSTFFDSKRMLMPEPLRVAYPVRLSSRPENFNCCVLSSKLQLPDQALPSILALNVPSA